jgi:predicted negative regulator of RcsB-dependent stress response
MDLETLAAEAHRLSGLLDRGVQALREAAVAYAEAEHAYRRAKAEAYLTTAGTVAEREAQTYGVVGSLRRDRDLADASRLSALEAVRSRRTQLSALQSLLAAHRSEADFARTGPR